MTLFKSQNLLSLPSPKEHQWSKPKEYRRLWTGSLKYRGMHFVWVTKQTTAWVVSSVQRMQQPNPLGEELVCLYSVLSLGQYTFIWQSVRASEKVNWITLLSCLKTCNDFTGLIKSNLNFSHAQLGPAWSDLCLHCKPCTLSPTTPGPLASHHSLWTLHAGCPVSGWLLLIFSSCMRAKLLQSCLTLCDPMNASLPGSSVRGTLQARVMKWVVMPSSRGSSWPRGGICVSMSPLLAGGFFTTNATWRASVSVFSLVRPPPRGKSNAPSSEKPFLMVKPTHLCIPTPTLTTFHPTFSLSLHFPFPSWYIWQLVLEKILYIFFSCIGKLIPWEDPNHTYIA